MACATTLWPDHIIRIKITAAILFMSFEWQAHEQSVRWIPWWPNPNHRCRLKYPLGLYIAPAIGSSCQDMSDEACITWHQHHWGKHQGLWGKLGNPVEYQGCYIRVSGASFHIFEWLRCYWMVFWMKILTRNKKQVSKGCISNYIPQ